MNSILGARSIDNTLDKDWANTDKLCNGKGDRVFNKGLNVLLERSPNTQAKMPGFQWLIVVHSQIYVLS